MDELYRISPEYRRLADELFRTKQEYGALRAAYHNAINDQARMKAALNERGGWNDDPGRGGSGGQRDG